MTHRTAGARSGLLAISLILLALAGADRAWSGEIALRWDPVPGAAGYRVVYGTSPGLYRGSVDVGNRTDTRLTGLADCATWHVAVMAYDGLGQVGPPSQPISGWPRPELTFFQPIPVRQGSQIVWTIHGANFEPGAEVRLLAESLPRDTENRPTLRMDALQVLDCRRAQALLTVEPLARGARAMPVGDFTMGLIAINPGSEFGLGSAILRVSFDENRWDINRSYQATRDRVDGADLAWFGFAFGQDQGQPRFLPDADLDGNGAVDGSDLALLAAGFGRCRVGDTWSTAACR